MRNLIKYTIGLPFLVITTLLLIFVELIYTIINYGIVNSLRYIFLGEYEVYESLMIFDIKRIWKPLK
jgi:hypothetical protein